MKRITTLLRSSAGALLLTAVVFTSEVATGPGMAAAASGNLQITMTLDWNEEHQVIDGFGVAEGADYGPYLQGIPEPQRSQMLDLAFSQERGIGLNILRSQISSGPYGSNTNPSLEPNRGVWNYNDPTQVWLMKEAVSRGPVKLIASVWSPPSWMKSNNSVVGGGFDTRHYQDYADYLAHYADDYARANGVSIYAISMSNEPDSTFPPDYPPEKGFATCAWTADQMTAFLGSYLLPTFQSRGLSTKIMAPENTNWDRGITFTDSILRNSAARARVDIVADHVYPGGNYSLPISSALAYGKPVWQTESSIVSDPWSFNGALGWAHIINSQLSNAQVSAWLWWVLAAGQGNETLMSFHDANGVSDGHTFYVSKAFWALGQFSKFIRPGFVRIGGALDYTGVGVEASAYKDRASGDVMIVVINGSSVDRDLQFNASGLTAATMTPYITSATQNIAAQAPVSFAGVHTVPALSIVTYVSHRQGQFDVMSGTPNARTVTGDFNGDGRTDVALVGGTGWSTVPIAFSRGDGTFDVANRPAADFANWAAVPNVKVLTGDFNGDGRTDIALIGGDPSWWHTMPVALSNGDGTFNVTNSAVGDFDGWAATPNVKVLTGDFNGDGRADVALVGGDPSWWHTMPVAFSKGDGSFNITNSPVYDFAGWAATPNVKTLTGDFDGDGRADVALIGGDPSWWYTMPVAFSNGDGSFNITNSPVYSFDGWAATPNVMTLVGDFNGDHRADVALIGGDPSWWYTMPVAFSNGNGAFNITNSPVYSFAGWAATPNVKTLVGDFNGDHRADVALIGGDPSWWHSMPVAFSNGDGAFNITNAALNDFAGWAGTAGTQMLTGDFNGDGRSDVLLLNGSQSWWYTTPVAFSNGDGTFRVTNAPIP